MGNANVGYLKLAQEFRKDLRNKKYLPILNCLDRVASDNKNNLPSTFSISGLDEFSAEDVKFVLLKLYPFKNYCCTKKDSTIFCIK